MELILLVGSLAALGVAAWFFGVDSSELGNADAHRIDPWAEHQRWI